MKTIILIFALSITTSTMAKAKYGAILQGIDTIHSTGQDVTLKAKLERAKYFPTYRSDIPGEVVEFFLKEKYLGAALTDGDGVGSLTLSSLGKGLHEIEVKLIQGSEFKSKPANVLVLVIDKNTPIAISDIDHTISDASAFQVLLRPNHKLPPLKKAVQGIKYFSGLFQIIYLTARDDMFINKTKNWLAMYNFVKAPSFFWDFANRDVPNDHGDFKSWIITKLKDNFNNIQIAFGDKPHDIRAYRDHGLRSYYLGKQDAEIHKDGIKVKSWTKLLEHFKSNPIGSLSSDLNSF
ncbi:MAG: hypothetical protein KC493_02690 [Bacteriovoracaceae bacterium]|nr:hypothetical protein [Bacteriovoracaceae bacterium]